MQYHYVVMYDDESEEFTMDYESQDVRFNGMPLYNTETNEWERLEESHWEDDSTVYNRAGDALWFAVKDLQPLDKEN